MQYLLAWFGSIVRICRSISRELITTVRFHSHLRVMLLYCATKPTLLCRLLFIPTMNTMYGYVTFETRRIGYVFISTFLCYFVCSHLLELVSHYTSRLRLAI